MPSFLFALSVLIIVQILCNTVCNETDREG